MIFFTSVYELLATVVNVERKCLQRCSLASSTGTDIYTHTHTHTLKY